MDLDKVQKIMERFENSDIRELKLEEGNFHLYLSKNKGQAAAEKTTKTAEPAKKETAAEVKTADENSVKAKVEGTPVKAPIVGVVYLQAKPGEKPYVKVGDRVEKGETIAIIEAMKMMTEIKSTVTGIVTAINVENEDLVEVDQPLITVREDRA